MPSIQEPSSPRRYRADIDGLRAVAIILVILYHSGMHFFRGGYTGVDIFFVISGYLIGGHIYSEKLAGTFSYWSFYCRRARRILPALFVVLAFVSLIAIYTFPPLELRIFGISAFSVALSVSNLYFDKSVGYFTPRAEINPLLMTWSLGVEEQFYLFIPLILSLIVRIRRTLHLPALLAISLLSFGLCIHLGSAQNTFYWLSARSWELGAGVILAIFESTQNVSFSERRSYNVVAIAGALLLCLPLLTIRSNTIQAVQLLPTVAGTILLILVPSCWINRIVLASRPARFVGKISYSWYLWHWPLLALLRFYTGGLARPITIASTIAISFCVAVVSYFTIEQPFRKRPEPAKPAVLRYAALCLIAASIGISVWMLRGIPQRFPRLANLSRDQTRLLTDPCFVTGDKPNLSSKCYSIRGEHSAVAIWGDSHGAALSAGLRDYVTDRGYEFDQLTRGACRPWAIDTSDQKLAGELEGCLRFNEASLDKIATDGRIQIVIISFNWKRILQSDSMNICGTDDCFAYLKASIRRLQQSGKEVIVMGEPPEFDVDPVPSAYFSELWVWPVMTRMIGNSSPSEFGILSGEAQALDDRTDYALRKALSELNDVQYLRLHDLFCSESGCRFSQNGKILFLDTQHLSREGALLALTKLNLPAQSTASSSAIIQKRP